MSRNVDSCSVVAFFADVEAASWIPICSACVVFSCVLQSVCSVFNVQCVGSLFAPRLPRRQHIGQAQCGKKERIWIPCHQGTHHQHLQCRQHLIRIWMPCWHQPPVPWYHIRALVVPTLWVRIAQNAKLKECIVIIKGVANSDLLSKSFPNFTRIFFVLLFLKSFFALFVFVMLVVLYIFRNILCGFTNRPCAIHTYLQDCLRTERSRRSDKIFGAGEVWLRNHRLIKHISHTHKHSHIHITQQVISLIKSVQTTSASEEGEV